DGPSAAPGPYAALDRARPGPREVAKPAEVISRHVSRLRHGVRRQGHQLSQLGRRELGEPALAGADDALRELALVLDHAVDPLLERAHADQLADLDPLALADPEGAGGCLVLAGGVARAVEVE